jgi:hypothetical protein
MGAGLCWDGVDVEVRLAAGFWCHGEGGHYVRRPRSMLAGA